jgi:radical SAM protein with 4Fe4S-binding SPASM domain
MTFEGFPLIVGWELTLACNLCCKHCGSSAGLPRQDELSLEEALNICDQLPDLLVFEVDFTGGEPLVCSGWQQIAKRLGELKIRTKLITNGVLLNKRTIGELKDAGISRVGISIDGLQATHDAIRKCPGLFNHIIQQIEQLHHAGIPITAITTVNGLNISEMPSLLDLFQSLEIEFWQYQPIFPLGRARLCEEFALTESIYLQLGSFSKEFYSPDNKNKPLLSPGDSFGYFSEMDQRQPPWGGCSAGIMLCGITSNGLVKGCLSMPDELAEGDLRHRDLWDIWFDPNGFGYNRNFSIDNLGSNCYGCDLAEKCRGGCSSMSYSCTGSMNNDPFCFYSIGKRIYGKGLKPIVPRLVKRDSNVGFQDRLTNFHRPVGVNYIGDHASKSPSSK